MSEDAVTGRWFAVLSEDKTYRYQLGRCWDAEKPGALYIMLNPSTADAKQDDATIRSCVRLARSWGYGSITVVNLFAFRSTDPAGLLTADDPVGPMNDVHIASALTRCDFVLCAWGAHKAARDRAQHVLSLCRSYDRIPHCLGVTKSGAPRHPLYIKTGTTPELYHA